MNDDVKLRLWGPHPLHWLAVRERDDAKAEVARLREAIEEYRLWRPGEKGHAAAYRKLMEALDA